MGVFSANISRFAANLLSVATQWEHLMKRRFRTSRPAIVAVILLAQVCVPSGRDVLASERVFPGQSWQRLSDPAALGWSIEKLQAAKDYAKSIRTPAVMLVVDGQILDEWGETSRRFQAHSIRKSFLSALYGIHVNARTIRLEKTLAQLGIDDNEPSLTKTEKGATIGDLLKARSGVYHASLYSPESMKKNLPARGSHEPGTFWYYNNWDFNVLGTVFERETKTNVFAEFKARIGDPIGMEDFRVEDCKYVTGAASVYPAYTFRISARDLARFGLLYLRKGAWNGTQIVSTDWVHESTKSYSDASSSGGYGYLWWTSVDGRHLPGVDLPDGCFSARGSGGHYLLVVPDYDLVIVHRANTDYPRVEISGSQFGELVRLILAAKDPGQASK